MSSPTTDCPIAQCLKFLSGAWTHNIMWYLSKGPLRFGELRRALQGISAKVLADRLREMEKQGVILRQPLSDRPGAGVLYSLTDFGAEFEPIFAAMLKVANRLNQEQKDAPTFVTTGDELSHREELAEQSNL